MTTVVRAPSRAPVGGSLEATDPLLRIEGLRVTLRRPHRRPIPLVRDVTFSVHPGEVVCLVGESGSGKSVTARAVLGLMRREPDIDLEGVVQVDGVDLLGLSDGEVRQLRGTELAMVFQEPLSSLDPVCSVRSQLTEALRRRGRRPRAEERHRMVELLRSVGIVDADRVLRSYPHELSGGMCQRVMIAMALASRPKVLIADEPTTALDVTIQAQILDLIDRLRSDTGMGVVLVTHDMGVAADIADRIVVMYAGRVVEEGEPEAVFDRPEHPYTSGLLACVPTMVGDRPVLLPAIGGTVPDPAALPSGCAFHPRCPNAQPDCAEGDPPLEPGRDTVRACWHPNAAPGKARS